MRITVLTSNHARHAALIRTLAAQSEEVFAIQECNTLFPGTVSDLYPKSEVMAKYFEAVRAAECEVFGSVKFLPPNVRTLALKLGDLNRIPLDILEAALQSDYYVVFGASYIKGALCDALVERGALNIHLGTSPYYRGSSCNFWALYDGRADYVGATIHRLSKGLDSGAMLFHALPKPAAVDGFVLGMQAVRVAHLGLAHYLKNGEIKQMDPLPQDKSLQLRYARMSDFTDEIVRDYCSSKILDPQQIHAVLKRRDLAAFSRPFVG